MGTSNARRSDAAAAVTTPACVTSSRSWRRNGMNMRFVRPSSAIFCTWAPIGCRRSAKTLECDKHFDRDAQFHYINARAQAFLAAQPLRVGGYKRAVGSREWRCTRTREHHQQCRVVGVGTDHLCGPCDPRWRRTMGRKRTRKLSLITDRGADGSACVCKVDFRNGGRTQPITVCHLPPGHSKWNRSSTAYFISSPQTQFA